MASFSLDLDKIQWSQGTVSDDFKYSNDPATGKSVFETVVELLLGECSIEDIPAIRVFQEGSFYFTLSHQRLFVLKTYQKVLKRFNATAHSLNVSVVLAGRQEESMFTTLKNGACIEITCPVEPFRGREEVRQGRENSFLGAGFPGPIETPFLLPSRSASESHRSSSSSTSSPTQLPFTLVSLPELDNNMIICAYCEDKSSDLFRRASEFCSFSVGHSNICEDGLDWHSAIGCSLREQLQVRGAPWNYPQNWFWTGSAATNGRSRVAIGIGTSKVKCERAVRLALAATALSCCSSEQLASSLSQFGLAEEAAFCSFLESINPGTHPRLQSRASIQGERQSRDAIQRPPAPLEPPPLVTPPRWQPPAPLEPPPPRRQARAYSRDELVGLRQGGDERSVDFSLHTKRLAIAHSAYDAEAGGYMSLGVGDCVVLLSLSHRGESLDRYPSYIFGMREHVHDEDALMGRCNIGWFPEDVVQLRPQ